MKKIILICSCLLFGKFIFGQIGIGIEQPDQSALLDIVSNQKGLKLPIVNLTSTDDQTTVPSPVKGFIVYNQTSTGTESTSVSKGIYSYDGEKWNKLLSYDNTEERIFEIPFLAPIFIASNIVSGSPPSIADGVSIMLNFNKLDFDFQNGATGSSVGYTGYTIQEDGVYSISFSAEIGNTSSDVHGEQIIFVRRNGTNVCTYAMQRKYQFGGISSSCTYVLSEGDEITFIASSTGADYQIYNTNVSIYKSY